MSRTAALVALPLALAACGNPAPTPQEPTATTAPTTNPLIEQFADVKLVVDANGLGGKGAPPVRFGAARADVEAMAAKEFGASGKASNNAECGAGPMEFSQYGPLQVAFQDGRFAGWFLREGDGVVTSDGIRPGIPLDALKGERQVREIGTTLDGEFEYTTADFGTIRGFAEGGEITALQAGVSCFFR